MTYSCDNFCDNCNYIHNNYIHNENIILSWSEFSLEPNILYVE